MTTKQICTAEKVPQFETEGSSSFLCPYLLHGQFSFIPLVHSVSLYVIILQFKLTQSVWTTKPT